MSVYCVLAIALGAGGPQINETNVAPVVMEVTVRCGWGTYSKQKYTWENL